ETPSAVSFPDFAASSRLKATESTAVSALRNADSNFAIVVPGFGLNSQGRILVLRRPLRRSSELPARIVIRPLYGILKSAIYYFLRWFVMAPKIPKSSTRGVATGRQQSIPPMAFWLIDAVAPRCELGDRVFACALLCGDQRGHAKSHHHVDLVGLFFFSNAPAARTFLRDRTAHCKT